MWRRHFLRNLRTAFFIAGALALIAGLGGVWWANRTGLPEAWRATIEQEMGKQGAYLTIDSLSYIPFKGLIASGVRVFSDKERLKEVSRLERIVLDANKADLIRGKFRLTKVELSDARLSVPLDPLNPDSTRLEITELNGSVIMPGGRLLEVKNVTGNVAGIQIIFGARMLGFQQGTGEKSDDNNEGKRREIAAKIIRELEKWKFGDDKPPVIRIFAEGDLSDKSTLTARVNFQAREVSKNGHALEAISATATLTDNLLTVSSIHAVDSRGEFEGSVDYDISGGEGRFDIVSGLEIPGLLKAWSGLPQISQITFGGDQKVEAEGDFRLVKDAPPVIRVTGSTKCESVLLKGIAFDSLESEFSWRDGNLYLRDVLLSRQDGAASGKALIQGPIVQLALKTTLPSAVFVPFFQGQPLQPVIKDFGTMPGAKVEVELEGGFNTRDRTSWAYSGRGQVDHVTFRGVPVASAKSSFSLSHHELDFFDGSVTFNYENYALQNTFGGPNRGTAKVARVRYDPREKHVEINNIEGNIWAAPMVRLFAVKIADMLEVYRFHSPPALAASGIIDVTPQGRTDITVGFKSEKPADYTFLGENLTLDQPSGEVVIKGDRVTVNDLKLRAFDGPVDARFTNSKGRLEGELSWTGANLTGIGSTYGIDIKGGGTTTGRLEFSLTDGKIDTMDGTGLLGLEHTELFSVPMFGPLSKLVSGALNNKRAGYERAKSAFMNFQIRDGVLSSNDFSTSTSSLVFTGDGSIDLATKNIDMTIRMNARGFLGLITLPLRPFYGLFQFHGTGPMKDTEWKSELFTKPPESQEATLLNPPKARIVREN